MTDKTIVDVYNLLQDQAVELAKVKASVDTTKNCSEQNNRALRGSDGDPGLVAEVASLCRTQEECKVRLDSIDTLLHKGTDTVPGLVGQVRDLNKWKKELRYWYLLFIGAIVMSVISIALNLISRNLFPIGG